VKKFGYNFVVKFSDEIQIREWTTVNIHPFSPEASGPKHAVTGYRYHAYAEGKYWAPNDEKQNAQLDILFVFLTFVLLPLIS
jgi:hypothetical protein